MIFSFSRSWVGTCLSGEETSHCCLERKPFCHAIQQDPSWWSGEEISYGTGGQDSEEKSIWPWYFNLASAGVKLLVRGIGKRPVIIMVRGDQLIIEVSWLYNNKFLGEEAGLSRAKRSRRKPVVKDLSMQFWDFTGLLIVCRLLCFTVGWVVKWFQCAPPTRKT